MVSDFTKHFLAGFPVQSPRIKFANNFKHRLDGFIHAGRDTFERLITDTEPKVYHKHDVTVSLNSVESTFAADLCLHAYSAQTQALRQELSSKYSCPELLEPHTRHMWLSLEFNPSSADFVTQAQSLNLPKTQVIQNGESVSLLFPMEVA